jgi:hypothetical protein
MMPKQLAFPFFIGEPEPVLPRPLRNRRRLARVGYATDRQQVDGNVQAFQARDSQTVLVLVNGGNLWLEHAPFGAVPPARQQVDGNVNAE